MSSLFQQLEIEAFRKGITPRTKESIRWFQQKAREMGKVSRTSVMQDDALQLRNRPITKPYGNMYMYFYDANIKTHCPIMTDSLCIHCYSNRPCTRWFLWFKLTLLTSTS